MSVEKDLSDNTVSKNERVQVSMREESAREMHKDTLTLTHSKDKHFEKHRKGRAHKREHAHAHRVAKTFTLSPALHKPSSKTDEQHSRVHEHTRTMAKINTDTGNEGS